MLLATSMLPTQRVIGRMRGISRDLQAQLEPQVPLVLQVPQEQLAQAQLVLQALQEQPALVRQE